MSVTRKFDGRSRARCWAQMFAGGSVLALGLLTAETAHAADPADAPAAAAQNDETQNGGLGQIVVTAQRRAERIQDVPIAIAAVSAETMERQRIFSPIDLQVQVPSLTYNEFVGYAQPYLRGIGTDISQPNADPSVATYIDGVYVANAQGVLTSMLGVERVEVLEGPQGTLYGRNAVGGAINYYTLTPGQDIDAKLQAGYGNYDRFEASGRISGPISDKLSVGIYGAWDSRKTYLHLLHPATPDTVPDRATDLGFRFKAVFKPVEDFKLTGSFEYIKTRSPEADAYRQAAANALGYVFGATEPLPRRYETNVDYPQYNNTRQYAGTVKEEVDLGFANVLGITGYRDLYAQGSADYDATTAPVFAFGSPVITKAKQFSQELQLLSPSSSPVNWIIGGYYFHERAGQYDFNALSAFLLQPFDQIKFIGRVTTTSLATFGQVTVPVGEHVRITGGFRYSEDKKEFDGAQSLYAGGVKIADIPVADNHHKWTNFSPKATIDYKVGSNLFYATFSKGYKAGAYNVNIPTAPGPVNPEKITAFEIGNKSDLIDGKLRINTSLFDYKIKDLQIQTVRPSSSGSTVVQNAAEARIKGIEMSVVAAATPDLTLSVGGTYLDAKYKNFLDYGAVVPAPVGNTVVFIDASGNRLARTPKWAFSMGADFDHEFADESRITASVKASYKDKYYWDASNLYAQKSYWLVNASVGYTLPNTPVTVTAWATNLTNQYYNTILNASAFGVGVFDAPPRMYGLTIAWHLKSGN